MKTITRTLAALIALAVVAAAPAARAQQPTEVRVAVLAPSALLWLHAIAKDQGFYDANKIVVKELVAGSSPALLQAVSSGSVEAGIPAGGGVDPPVGQGAPVGGARAGLGKTLLRRGGGTRGEGTNGVGGAAGAAGAVEGGTANLLRYQLKRGGVDPRSVKMVALTNSRDRVVALGNGQVKGALLIAPFDTLAEREKMKVLDVYREPYIQTPLIFNKDWAAKNRAAAVGLAKALQKASVWIYNPANKQKAIDILAAYTKVPADVCADSYKFIVEDQKAIGRNLEVQAAGLENIINIDKDIGANPASSKPFDLSRYYDPSFLK